MTSCARHSDCAARHQCDFHGACVCPVNYGREGEDCTDFTPDCLWSIVVSFAGIILSLYFLVWGIQLLARTVSRGHRGYFLSTSFVCLLSAMATSSGWSHAFTHAIYPSYPSTAAAWTLINNIHIYAHGTLLLLAALNLSLMWIEFIIASKRLLRVGRNLRLTASFLFWYMVFFVMAAITGLVINIVVNRFGYILWVLSTCATSIMLICLLTVGSVRISAVLLREARRVSKISKEVNSLQMANENRYFSVRLRSRAENIVSCSRQIRAACLCYIISIIGKFAADHMRAPTSINWILFACISTSLYGIQWAIMSCVGTSIRIDQVHPGRAATSRTGSSLSLHCAPQPRHELEVENPGVTVERQEIKREGGNANDVEASGSLFPDRPNAHTSANASVGRTGSDDLASAPPVLAV